MKRIFLDTNILIDYIQGRERGSDAEQLLTLGHAGEISLTASYLTFANIAYIVGRKMDVYALLDSLTGYIEVLPMDGVQFRQALRHHVRDFEDMLQYQCAKAAGCDVIVTNNKHDFTSFCNLPLMTAEELLTMLADKEP